MDQTWSGALMMLLLVMLVGAMLAVAPDLAMAQAQTGSDQVDGAKQVGEGTAETAAAKTPSKSGARQEARDVGDQLHDSAKAFGEALLGGIKHAGRTVIDFFSDDKPGKQGEARP
jgi:hypothetical protein